jgi:hypothetical protein
MPFGHERIKRKYQLFEQLDAEHEIELAGTFTNHLVEMFHRHSYGTSAVQSGQDHEPPEGEGERADHSPLRQ